MTPRVLAHYGPTGQRVRVVVSKHLVTVEWYVRGVRRQRSWPDTRENRVMAREWARVFAEERSGIVAQAAAPALTLREVWDRYVTANFAALRPATRKLYTVEWRRWELFAGRSFVAQDITREMIHAYRRALETEQRLGVNSIQNAIRTCKVVYNWAAEEELIARNRWGAYKPRIGKDAKPKPPAEYTQAEADRIMAELSPLKATQWRAWVAVQLLGHQGVRQVAGLQLRWADLRLGRRGIQWPAATDKTGRGMFQPLRRGTVRALRVARDWARRLGIESPYVLPAGSRKNTRGHYTIQSFWRALHEAEQRAGVPWLPNRAGHGFRRLAAGNIWEQTGNALLALRSIGDRDPRRAEEYLQTRDQTLRQAFRQADRADQAGRSHRIPTAVEVVGEEQAK